MAFAFADLIAIIIWSLFFASQKRLRQQMLLMSLLASPLAVFDLFFVPAYWQPVTFLNLPIGVEGFIYSFCAGGIAAVGYCSLTKHIPKKIKHYHRQFALLAVISILPLFLLLNTIGTPNVMISLYIALLFGVALTIFFRKDLFPSALLGGLIFGTIYFVSLILWLTLFPQAKNWFTVRGLSKTFLFNAPLWEVLFGFFFGAYWGNLYELLFGYKFQKT